MARLIVANKTGTHRAEITERSDSYRWACSCGESFGFSRRKDDVIEYASQHVDTHR